MVNELAEGEIRAFFEQLGENLKLPTKLFLLGGSALTFLGNPRRTIDIDCALDLQTIEAEEAIKRISNQLKIEVEILSFEEFIPIPEGSEDRHHQIGQFGNVDVFIFDPYSIALSKVARGFDTDIQDVLFLLDNDHISLEKLINIVNAAVPVSWDYDINPTEMRNYLEVVINHAK